MTKTTDRDAVVAICLDETGSMLPKLSPTISGFNEYVDGLRKQEGKTTMTVTLFSDKFGVPKYRPLVENVKLKDVPTLSTANYGPEGNTPLFDAIGHTIEQLGAWLDSRTKKPPTVLVVIQTDGLENASREFTREQIVDLIREREGAGWRFVYLGADQDEFVAERAAMAMGMSRGSTFSYDSSTSDVAFAAASAGTNYLRGTGGKATGQSVASTMREEYANHGGQTPDGEQAPEPTRPKKAKQRRRLAS